MKFLDDTARAAARRPHRPPSTSALRAFAVAARLSSVTRAAAELSLTQSAVSHQIRELEQSLGTRLFERKARGISLTESGRAYLPFVLEALDRLRAGAEAVDGSRRERVLNISVSPNFAAKWLVPRLGAFVEAHPELDLRISASARHVTFDEDDIDVAVRHGDGDWPHLAVRRLCAETLFPVCSPATAALLGPEPTLANLAGHTLLHDRDRDGWARWLREIGAGAGRLDVDRGPVFSQASLAMDAAIAGQGVALARSALAALDVLAGRLVRAVPEALPAKFSYWIVCRKGADDEPKISALAEWLVEEAARDARAVRESAPASTARS